MKGIDRWSLRIRCDRRFQWPLPTVADRLELTKSAVYYHHPTKADLVSSVVQPAVDDVATFLDEIRRTGPSARELLERFFDLNYRHRRVFLALLRDPTGLGAVHPEDWIPRLPRTSRTRSPLQSRPPGSGSAR